MKKMIALLLCLLGSASLWAQENTVLGTGALSQAGAPKYAIKEFSFTNAGSYSRPTVNFGGHQVEWAYLGMSVDNEVWIEGEVKSSTDLTGFTPTITGGHGSGATVWMYFQYIDGEGKYVYYLSTGDPGSGYAPTITLSPMISNNVYIQGYIDENNQLKINYSDYYKQNIYSAAPIVSISFGGATAVAVLEGTAANGQNTAIGYQALHNATAYSNIAVGDRAGLDLTTGKNNTFIGTLAGKGITTGSGNTILGNTNTSFSNFLSNSVLLADGNGNNRMYISPNGNTMLGYGSNLSDDGFKLDVSGDARITNNIYANGIDAFQSTSSNLNKVITYDINQVIQAPTTKVFMDLLAFNKKGYGISYQTSNDKVNFTAAPVNMSFFAGKTGTEAQQQIIDGSSVKAVRWTWSGVIYGNARWLALDYGYANGTNAYIVIEQSLDNVNWEVMHQSSHFLGSSGLTKYHFINHVGDRNYIRLTITHQSGGFVNLSAIRLLTFRHGNQGAAQEHAYPYTWNKDGWIGINKGIAEPEYPLDVNGASRFGGTMFLNSSPVTSEGAYELITRNTSSGAIEKLGVNLPTTGGFNLQGITDLGSTTNKDITIQNTYPYFQLKADAWAGNSAMQAGVDLTSTVQGNYFSFMIPAGKGFNFKRGPVNDMVIAPDGNVGIGITDPHEKLAVNGKIRAREVKIEPTDNWPDYVFEESYKPMSLAEISTFVKQHKHLPEVPSAKEVAQNGLELGEMNKVLLKKIEELTLHLIEKDKQLAETNQKVDKLAELLEKLLHQNKNQQ